MKKLMFIVFFILPAIFSTAPGAVAYWETVQLTNNELDDEYPDINSSGWVTWGMRSPEGSAFKIFLHNGSETTCISGGLEDDNGMPRISDNGNVTWTHSNAVYLYNGSELLNLSGSGIAGDPSINSTGQIVWARYDSSPPDYPFHDREIMFYDGSSITQITDNELLDEKPCIDDNSNIYWPGDNSGGTLGFYDGIVQYPFWGDCENYVDRTNNIPCSNGYAVWNCRSTEGGGLYLFNGLDVIKLAESGLSPQVNDNGWVVWVNVTWSSAGFPNHEIMLYDGETTIQLTDNDLEEDEPKINNNNQVVWRGHDGNDLEIFMYDNGQVLQLTDNCYDDKWPEINDIGEVTWFGHDGNDYEIYVRRWKAASSTPSAYTYGHLSNEGFSSVKEIGESDIIVAGETQENISSPGDIWLSRMDSSGNVLWQKTYGGEKLDGDALILPTGADNSIFLAGRTASFGSGETDIWLLKLDGTGTVEWQKTYGSTEHDWMVDLLKLRCSEGYILAGGSMSYDAYNYGDIWIMKFDESGNIAWQKRYGTDGGTEWAFDIEQTGDGGYIVAGTTNSFGGTNGDIWILKLDGSGNIEWEKSYGSTGIETGARLRQTGDGGYIVACESYSFGASQETSDLWLLKLDAAGDIEWQNAYIIPYDNELSSIVQTTYGNFIVAANRAVSYSGIIRNNQGVLMRLAPDGSVTWIKGYPCSIDDLLRNDAGGYTAVGYSEEFSMGQRDGCVIRLDEYGETACSLTETVSVSVTPTDISAVSTSADVYDTSVTGVDTTAAVADFSSYRRDICEPKPLISLPKTGQTLMYATGDDGDIQAGLDWPAPRFTDNGDGTITDNLTGLTWLKDATCLGKQAWSDEVDSYPAKEAIGDLNANPGNYACAGYTGTHTDWRMPSINELSSLVNIGAENSALWLMDQGFLDVEHASTYDRYWTDTEHSDNAYYAWIIQFNEPSYDYVFTTTKGKDDENWVWPVRGRNDSMPDEQYPAGVWSPDASGGGGVMWPSPRLVDNGDGTVTDNLTGLMWLKDAECFDFVPWADTFAQAQTLTASTGCEEYTADYADWRVPNLKELHSLVDFGNWRHALPTDHPFIMGDRGINALSSSTVAGRDTDFYWVSFDSGLIYGAGKASASNYRLLPVRTPTFTVAFVEGENGTITGDLVQYVHMGENCTEVTAIPGGGYRFVGWTGDYNGTENPLTVTNVASHMTITAGFLPDTAYEVTFTAGENGSVTGDLDQTVLYGGDCTPVTAVAQEGYYFIGWEGSYSGADNPLTVTGVTSDMTITAGFLEETCFGDFDRDGEVDGSDLAAYLNRPDYLDLDQFAESFGKDCFE